MSHIKTTDVVEFQVTLENTILKVIHLIKTEGGKY